MDFRVDFTNVETKNFDPIPIGRYLVAVTDAERGECGPESKNPGAPRVQHEFTVQEPIEINGMKVAERKLWCNFMPTVETTLFMLKGFLAALGDDVSGALNYNPSEILARPLEKRLVVVKVGIQGKRKDKKSGKEYEPRNEIRQFYPAADWDGGAAAAGGGAKSLLPG